MTSCHPAEGIDTDVVSPQWDPLSLEKGPAAGKLTQTNAVYPSSGSGPKKER